MFSSQILNLIEWIKDKVDLVWAYTQEHQWANVVSHTVLAIVYAVFSGSVLWVAGRPLDLPFALAFFFGTIISFFAYLFSEAQEVLITWIDMPRDWHLKVDYQWDDHFFDLIGPLNLVLVTFTYIWFWA